jgi:hypothetical protein
MTEPLDGKAILAAIHYVREFYEHIARMLGTADHIVGIMGWNVHGEGWKAVSKRDRSLRSVEYFMPNFVIRQYFRVSDPTELLTIAAIPHDPVDGQIEQPLCLVSRVRWRKTATDDIYWVPQMQLRRTAGLGDYGKVMRIRRDDIEVKPARMQAWDALVINDELLSLVVPLVSVVDEESLRATLSVLLEATFEGDPAGAPG